MICNVRTLNGVEKELRKLLLNNRKGLVYEKIATHDIEEVVISMEMAFKTVSEDIANSLNKPIVIRTNIAKDTGRPEYTLIYTIKTNKIEDLLRRKELLSNFMIINNLISFNDWARARKYI